MKLKFNFWKDKIFLKSMFAIAIPIALQNLITSSLNMVDTLMISSLGQAAIAGVGLANQLFFFYILISFGISSGSSIFIAQYWGKEDVPSIRKILGLALTLSAIVGTIFTIVAMFFPEYVMRFFIDEPEVIRLGSEYLRVVSLSYTITAITFAYSVALRSTGRPKVPMMVSAISFVTNTVFNYLLIFGKFGFPELGVKGAAWGTVIARVVEITIILYSVYSTKGILAAKLSELLSWHKEFLIRYIRTTSPVIINEAFWSLAHVMYSVAFAKLGEEATAAVQIATTIQNVFFVIVRGLSNACTVMVGNKIGSGDEDGSYEYAVQFLTITILIGIVLGLAQTLTPGLTLKLFRGLEPNLYLAARKLLVTMGFFFIIRMINSTIIVGILRGGGDTTFSMYLDIGGAWLVGVPLAFLGALVFNLPIHYVYALSSCEEVFKAIIGIPRVFSKKWIKNVT